MYQLHKIQFWIHKEWLREQKQRGKKFTFSICLFINYHQGNIIGLYNIPKIKFAQGSWMSLHDSKVPKKMPKHIEIISKTQYIQLFKASSCFHNRILCSEKEMCLKQVFYPWSDQLKML